MNRSIAIFTLLTLVCAFLFLGLLKTDAVATEQELPPASSLAETAEIPQAPAPEETTPPTQPTVPAETLPEETEDAAAEAPEADADPSEEPEPLRETLYATTDVNVRTGPGTQYAKIDVLPRGNSVIRTEAGSNGWSKVDFNGAEGYIRSRYLSATEPANSVPEQSHLLTAFDNDSVLFNKVDETVYAITTVNVRVGPGTQYAPLGQCSFGQSVQRTGIGDNGWSRVIYNGETAYIHSSYLSDTKPQYQSSGRTGLSQGMYGRLTIPSLGINVGLYYCSSDEPDANAIAQSIVDAQDSAVYLYKTYVQGAIIADHKNQGGFSAVRSCIPNQTIAYIDYGTHTTEYICTAIGLGTNTGNDLLDWTGNSLNYGSIPTGLAMYTCNENWNNVTISYWKEN